MANWNGTARSNYFKVRDEAAFLAWVETVAELVATKQEGGAHAGKFWLSVHGLSDSGGWPNTRFNETAEPEQETEDMDLPAELAPHLADGEVAVLMEAGAEKLRYITGNAVAVHSSGETVEISLHDIYKEAAEAFPGCNAIVRAEY